MGGVKAQTPRAKRLQTREEWTKKVQTSEGTPKATIAQVKEKEPLAKQAKSVKTGSTGSPKTASIGSQKTVSTRLSIGSLGKGQQKEKSPKYIYQEEGEAKDGAFTIF